MRAALFCISLAACSASWRVSARRATPVSTSCPTLALILADAALSALSLSASKRSYDAGNDDATAAFALVGLGFALSAHLSEATCDR